MNLENIQDFEKRRNSANFRKIMKKEHELINCISFEDKSIPKKSVEKRSRQSIIKTIGYDMFFTNYVDGYKVKRKFLIVSNVASDKNSYNFWNLIWENNCRVLVRLDRSNSKDNCLNDPHATTSTSGEFVIQKKTITGKFYTKHELNVKNTIDRKSKSITHYHYDDLSDCNHSSYSKKLLFFLEEINKEQSVYRRRKTHGNKCALGPIVIQSIGCFERMVSICVLDICVDQLVEAKSVSVPDVLLKVKTQVPFENFSLDEYIFINITLLDSICVSKLKEEIYRDSNPKGVSFRCKVKKYFLLFKRAFVP